VDLQNIDIRSQSSNTFIDGIDDVLTAQAHLVQHITFVFPIPTACYGLRGDAKEAFGEDDEPFSWDLVLLDCLAYDLL
jgi:hypothetical protein